MQSGKAPGLDSFPVEYYKLYNDILVPVFIKVYSESVSQLLNTLNESVISNVDYKILTKVLAMQLENVVSWIYNRQILF